MVALPFFIVSILSLIRGRNAILQNKAISSRTLLNEVTSAASCTVQHADWIGDGWCDKEYNTYECNYDMGDCCQSTCNYSVCGVLGYRCENPDAEENKQTHKKPSQGSKEGNTGKVTGNNGNQGSTGTGGGNGNQGDSSGGGGNDNQGDSSGGGGNSNQGDSSGEGGNGNQGDSSGGGSNDNQGDSSGGSNDNQGDSSGGGNNGNQGDSSGGSNGNQGDSSGGGSNDNQGDSSGGSNGNQGDSSGGGSNDNQGDSSGGGNGNQGDTPLPSLRPTIVPTLTPTSSPSAIPTSDTGGITDDQSNVKGIFATSAPSRNVNSAFNFTFYLMNTTMNCFDKSDSWVTYNEQVIRCALVDYGSISSITNVTFFPVNPIRNSTAYVSSKISNYENRSRKLLGALQATMIATTIIVSTLPSQIAKEKAYLFSSIKSGKLEKKIRFVSRQSYGLALDYAVVCSSDSIQTCLNQAIASYSSLDQCSMTASDWDHLYARESFKGYIIWIAVLIILWTFLFGIATGPIIFLRFDLWPSFRTWVSKSSAKALVAARFKQGCSVAFISICRIVQLALIISLTFDLEAPNFACVEFAFNRQVGNDSTETFSTPLLEALQSIFYFFFLIAVLCRQDWYDAEIRRHGIIIHAPNSRSHMSMCSLFRQILSVIAVTGTFGVIVFLIIVSVTQKNSRTSKDFSMVIRASQITCALLAILIQLYHWKALWGIATMPYKEGKEEREDLFCSLEGGDRKRSESQNVQKKLAQVHNQDHSRELSFSEIFTGDNAVAGNASTSGMNRKGDIINDSQEKEQKQPKIEKPLDTAFSPSAFSPPGQLLSSGDLPGGGDDGVLLTENYLSELRSAHCPAISDNSTWIVLITCIWFLITSIPEFLRFYLSAFLLYSTITRILEIVTASLLLSPFLFRNTPLRRRLAEKIRKEAALQSSSKPKEFSERGNSGNFSLNDENDIEISLTVVQNPHHSSSARPLKAEGRLEYKYKSSNGDYNLLGQGKNVLDRNKYKKDSGPGSSGIQSPNDSILMPKQQSRNAWVGRWLDNSNSISIITAATNIATRDNRIGENSSQSISQSITHKENDFLNSSSSNEKENQKQDDIIQKNFFPAKSGSTVKQDAGFDEDDAKILRPLFSIRDYSKQPLPKPGSLKYRSTAINGDMQGTNGILGDTEKNASIDCLTVSTKRANNRVKIEKIEGTRRNFDDTVFDVNNGNVDSRNDWINKSNSRLTRRKFALDDFDSKSPKSPKSR